jgi:alpha-L-fucosidase 2
MEADTVRRGGLSPSLQALFGHTAVDDQTRPLLREMSAINFVKPGLPPFLLIHGDADKSVPYEQSVRFQTKLKENGVPCELIVIKDAPHRITDWSKFDTSYQACMITWLEGNLAAK